MRTSKIYLVVSFIGFFVGAGMLPLGLYPFTSISWMIAIVFFTIYMAFKIIEMLSDIEKRSQLSYQELDNIFQKKYGRKRKKKVKVKGGGK